MSNWDFPGARWWKFDFHTHTPASHDFMRNCSQEDINQVTPEFWLRKFMDEGIHCVAVTDHNSGAWIDGLKETLEQIRIADGDQYRPLYLFPGVEISVNGGIHMLAIFDPERNTSDIDGLLGAVDYNRTKDNSDGVTRKSVSEVIDAINEAGGIAIPAHVDKDKGLLEPNKDPNTQKQAFENPNIHAMELCDSNFHKPQIYEESKAQWTEVCGSDTHNFRTENFGIFTWIKMDTPSIEGLKLALIDGHASVKRNVAEQPNKHAEFVIESIEVSNARYMGRGGTLKCEFSPFLNSIIGGRGSGKSTLLEFMRFVLRRKTELPERFKQDYKNYFSTGQDGLLSDNSNLHLVYRKGDFRYRLNWAASPRDASLEKWDEQTRSWEGMEGEISSLFPVSIYSQKQIFELAKNPQGLLDIIDQAPDVESEAYHKEFQDCTNDCKQIAQQHNQLDQKIVEESKLKGQLSDFIRQIEQVEKSGHKDVLRNYQLRRKQLSEIDYVERHWQELFDNMIGVIEEADTAPIDSNLFATHPDILAALEKAQQQWKQQVDRIEESIRKQIENLQHWKQNKTKQDWMKTLNVELQQYEQLRNRLEEQGIDPQAYPDLLQKRALTEKNLQQIEGYKQQKEKLGKQYAEKLAEAKSHRQKLTERRTRFLERILKGNQTVKIVVKPFAEPWADMEKKIRNILHTGDRFDKDIEALKKIADKEGWEQAKKQIRDIRSKKTDAKDNRFQAHLRGLPLESGVDMGLWFPEDALQITYGEKNKKLSGGSPGQKSAALLAFILAYGDEPLLLDQPEDDLDNDLIYSLIVRNIKATKTKRQIIIVTHNANITVNGDSEMVHCLSVGGGQSHITSDSLQTKKIREKICNTMEGGRIAFEERYKRIHLEG